MMKINSNIELMRLKSMLISDKVSVPNELCSIIKSDVYILLLNYMELKPENIIVSQTIEESGFCITIKARTDRLKQFGALPK